MPESERIAFVFDQHHLKGRAAAAFADFKTAPLVTYRDRLGGAVFDDKKRIKPLQAADILAYETFRHLHESMLRGQPERWQMTALKKNLVQIGYFDAEGLDAYIKNLKQNVAAGGSASASSDA